jgi:hypothetical protein
LGARGETRQLLPTVRSKYSSPAALLDGADRIDVVHLRAASAVWDYAEQSAKHIFNDATGNRIMDAILPALRAAGEGGMTRTAIFNLFDRHESKSAISTALQGSRRLGGRSSPPKKAAAGQLKFGRPRRYRKMGDYQRLIDEALAKAGYPVAQNPYRLRKKSGRGT